MRIILHPLAEAELSEAVSFYEDRALGLGQDFILDFEKTLARISDIPKSVLAWVRECENPLSPLSFQHSVSLSR